MSDDITVTRQDLIREVAAEKALADDLYYWANLFVDAHHDEAQAVLARYREARA